MHKMLYVCVRVRVTHALDEKKCIQVETFTNTTYHLVVFKNKLKVFSPGGLREKQIFFSDIFCRKLRFFVMFLGEKLANFCA